MNISNNYSDAKFAIQNDGERYAWAAYSVFIFLSSVAGDTLILIGSLNKDTFKINQFLVTIIQHIAVVDLGVTISDVLPTLISQLANSWVLGHYICTAAVYVGHIMHSASKAMIALMTTSKFLLLKYPLRTSNWTKKRGHQMCVIIWIACLIIPLSMIFQPQQNKIVFDYRIYSCIFAVPDNQASRIILPTVSIIFLLLPNIVIVFTSIPVFNYIVEARKAARRVQGNVPWQGALTVGLTALVYTISNLPNFFFAMLATFLRSQYTTWFHIYLYRVAQAMMLINIISNFYIYALTIRSFRRYIFLRESPVVPVSTQESSADQVTF